MLLCLIGELRIGRGIHSDVCSMWHSLILVVKNEHQGEWQRRTSKLKKDEGEYPLGSILLRRHSSHRNHHYKMPSLHRVVLTEAQRMDWWRAGFQI